MSRELAALVASPQCWSTNVLQQVKQALQLLTAARQRDAQQDVRREPPTAADLVAFQQWLEKHTQLDDATLPVAVEAVGGAGRGLVARREIVRGERFITIPYDAVIASDLSHLSPTKLGRWDVATQDPLLSNFPSCMLALLVLAEACEGSQSAFSPYVAVLPERFDIPVFYDESDFAGIEGSSLFEPSVKLLYNSLKQFFYIQQLIKTSWSRCPIPLQRFTLSNYLWALGVAMTRQNEIPVRHGNRVTSVLGLIPGWDMCNHEPSDAITTFSDPDKRLIACHAMRDFKQNEEVTMFYGPRSSEHLLLYSGFVVPHNAFDRVTIQLEMDEADPLAKIRRMLLQKEVSLMPVLLAADGTLRVEIDASGQVTMPQMTRVIQILVMEKASLSAALRASASIAVPGGTDTYSITNDEALNVKRRLTGACQRRMKSLDLERAACTAATRRALFQQLFDNQEILLSNALKSQCVQT
ncbi:hypothetical protein ATCC90586_001766 [Pythium insidiosum]|nr:hypothetical protein ATCC90586_001766 [Pythium insidiosum]